MTNLDKSNSKYEILIGLDHPNGTILDLKNQKNKKIIELSKQSTKKINDVINKKKVL